MKSTFVNFAAGRAHMARAPAYIFAGIIHLELITEHLALGPFNYEVPSVMF